MLAGFASSQALNATRTSQTQRLQLESALLQPNLPENRSHILEVFASLDESNVDSVARTVSDQIYWLNDCEYLPFLQAWLRFDREAALDHALAWGERSKSLRAVAETIFLDAADGRTQDALELLSLEIPGKERGGDDALLRSAYFRGLVVGGTSVEEVVEELERLNDPATLPRTARELVNDVAGFRGIESAMALASLIAGRFGSRVADAALTGIVEVVAIDEPARVQLWLDEHPNTIDATSAKSELAMIWSESDPHAALAWTLTLSPALRSRAFSAALGSWLQRDAETAAQWARQNLPEETHAFALPVLVRKLRLLLPQEAAYWANQIADPRRRISRLLDVLYPWWNQDAEAADRWVANAELSASMREEVDAARDFSRRRPSRAAGTESHEGT